MGDISIRGRSVYTREGIKDSGPGTGGTELIPAKLKLGYLSLGEQKTYLEHLSNEELNMLVGQIIYGKDYPNWWSYEAYSTSRTSAPCLVEDIAARGISIHIRLEDAVFHVGASGRRLVLPIYVGNKRLSRAICEIAVLAVSAVMGAHA